MALAEDTAPPPFERKSLELSYAAIPEAGGRRPVLYWSNDGLGGNFMQVPSRQSMTMTFSAVITSGLSQEMRNSARRNAT